MIYLSASKWCEGLLKIIKRVTQMANFVNVLLNIITSGSRINVKRMKYRKHLHPFSGCFEQPVSFQEVKRLV